MNMSRMVLAGMLATVAVSCVPGLNAVEPARADVCVTVYDAPPGVQGRQCTKVLGDDAVNDDLCPPETMCRVKLFHIFTGQQLAQVDVD